MSQHQDQNDIFTRLLAGGLIPADDPQLPLMWEVVARAIADWLLTGLIGAAPGASLEPAAADADRARPHSRTGASS